MQERGYCLGVCGDCASRPVAASPRAKEEHSNQRRPSAYGVNHGRSREVMKGLSEPAFQEVLIAKEIVPGHTLKEGVHEPHHEGCCNQLRPESRALSNAA